MSKLIGVQVRVITFHIDREEEEKALECLAMIRPLRSSLQTITMVVYMLLGDCWVER